MWIYLPLLFDRCKLVCCLTNGVSEMCRLIKYKKGV